MRKLISFILCGIMLFTCFNTFAENVTEISLSENGTLILRSEIAQLEDIGVMNDVGTGACQHITRGEMSKIVTQLFAMPDIYEDCDFEDVAADNPYAGSISFVSRQKIMNGYGENLFCPDESITYHEILKTVVSLLGYEPLAEQRGGYPTGYIRVANEHGLTLFPAGTDYPLTKEETAKILIKAIDVPLMVQTSYGETVTYEISADTLKSKYLIPDEGEETEPIADEKANEKAQQHENKINSVNELIKYSVIGGDPDGSLRLADTITKAEAAVMIVRINSNYNEILRGHSYIPAFDDIKNHWAEKEITFAVENDLAEVTYKTQFEPEKNVTVQEFAKMVVTLLGYKETAEQQGGLPHGYMITAHRLGLFDSLYLEGASDISRGEVAVILVNALDVPLMKQTGFGAEVEFTVMDGKEGAPLETLRTIIESE